MLADERGPLRKIVFTTMFLLLYGTLFCAYAQSLSSLRVGEDVSRLSTLGSAPSANETYKSFTIRKWKLSNENQLSVTTSQSGKIIYIESDWNGLSNETACDLSGLKFGVTTLSELRKRFGSNGFEFQYRSGVINIPDGIVMMNSYEVGTIVVTFITKVTEKDYMRLKESGHEGVPADIATLDAISLADADYAKNEWGDRIYDPNYIKIEWK
jgi:hypothetical protein